MDPLPVPSLARCLAIYGPNDGQYIYRTLLAAQFRSADSLKKQIELLKSIGPMITVRLIGLLMNLSTSQYYKAINSKEVCSYMASGTPSRLLLTMKKKTT